MSRGRVVVARAERLALLERYSRGGKINIMVALPGHEFYENHGRVNLFYVDKVLVAHQNNDEEDYPSEVVMATLALAIGATTGFEGIPATAPTHRVSQAAKDYNAALAATNRNRPDMQ